MYLANPKALRFVFMTSSGPVIGTSLRTLIGRYAELFSSLYLSHGEWLDWRQCYIGNLPSKKRHQDYVRYLRRVLLEDKLPYGIVTGFGRYRGKLQLVDLRNEQHKAAEHSKALYT